MGLPPAEIPAVVDFGQPRSPPSVEPGGVPKDDQVEARCAIPNDFGVIALLAPSRMVLLVLVGAVAATAAAAAAATGPGALAKPVPVGCCCCCCCMLFEGGTSHGVSCRIGVVPHRLFENNSSGMDERSLLLCVGAVLLVVVAWFAIVLVFVADPIDDDDVADDDDC